VPVRRDRASLYCARVALEVLVGDRST